VAVAAGTLRCSPLRPVEVLSSDLLRCRQTADVLAGALGVAVRTEAGLRERSFGVLEGQLWQQVPPAAVGITDGRVTDPLLRPAGGESVADLRHRVRRTLDPLRTRPGPVLVVTHGGPIRVLTGPVDLRGMPWGPVPHAVPVSVCLARPGCPAADRTAAGPVRTVGAVSRPASRRQTGA
jgi:broad specificity phosphatase PhoE